jgi:hypothetical protein
MNYSTSRPLHKRTKKTLSRSNTRMAVLEHCERKYFLNYYTFALKQDNPELWAEATLLK